MPNASIQISNDSGVWRVLLNGRDVADYLTPDGVSVEILPRPIVSSEDVDPVAYVRLTFADVELDADLRDAVVKATTVDGEWL